MSTTDTARVPLRTDLRFLLRGQRGPVAVLCGTSLVATLAEAFLLATVVQSIASLSSGARTLEVDLGPVDLGAPVTLMLGCAVLAAVLRWGCWVYVSHLAASITAASRGRMRRDLLSGFMRADWETRASDPAGRFLQVFGSSVNDAAATLTLAGVAFPSAIAAVALVGLAVVIDPLATLAVCAVGAVVVLGTRPLSKRAFEASRGDVLARQDSAAHAGGITRASAEVGVLGARSGALRSADAMIDRAERNFAATQRDTRVVGLSIQSAAFLAAALGVLAVAALDLDVDFAVLGTIAVLMLRVAGLAQQVQSATSAFNAFRPFIGQVRTVTEEYVVHRDDFGDRPFPDEVGLRLRDVSYTYPGTEAPAITVDDLEIAPGALVAVVGSSGSGKSTLGQVLLRLRTPQRGEVLVGATPLAAISEAEFGRRVAFVPQAPHLVPGTVGENIVFFRDGIGRAEVEAAARRAHVHDEILAMPQGYDTPLEAQSDQLSGGQKQRLALARALLASPRLLVLDEPTSALDGRNEALLLQTLAELRGETTVVMVTHRATEDVPFDVVVQVEGGRVRDVRTAEHGRGEAQAHG